MMIAVVSGASRDYDDYAHLSSDDSSAQMNNVLTDSALGIVRICSGLAYEILKTGLISYHCSRMGYSDCRNNSQSALYSRLFASDKSHAFN